MKRAIEKLSRTGSGVSNIVCPGCPPSKAERFAKREPDGSVTWEPGTIYEEKLKAHVRPVAGHSKGLTRGSDARRALDTPASDPVHAYALDAIALFTSQRKPARVPIEPQGCGCKEFLGPDEHKILCRRCGEAVVVRALRAKANGV